jgi:hypothetical protein
MSEGDIIDNYRLLELRGEGECGQVFQVQEFEGGQAIPAILRNRSLGH